MSDVSSSSVRPRSWFFHVAAMLLLIGLDGGIRTRAWLLRYQRRLLLIAFTSVMTGIVLTSLVSLSRIAEQTEILLDDAMVGLKSSTGMRPLIMEMHFEVLRLDGLTGHELTPARLAAFKTSFTEELGRYRSGVFSADDNAIASRIEQAGANYIQSVMPLVNNQHPSAEQLVLADTSVEVLLNAITQARKFSLQRLTQTAGQAKNSADRALSVSLWLWFGFLAVVGVVVFAVLLYRLLGVSDRLGQGGGGSRAPWNAARAGK